MLAVFVGKLTYIAAMVGMFCHAHKRTYASAFIVHLFLLCCYTTKVQLEYTTVLPVPEVPRRTKKPGKSRKKHFPGSLAMFQHYFSKQEGLRHMQDDIADIRLAARESLLEVSSDGLVV